ncbi:SA1362 family protein [Paucisalibacillus sp. EB02]|uniref:SA1362 family protein n=1 Tax=Paucisalibacillus sp. EB02 TaxID=1347087 RepID=UPI0004B9BFFC|nr:SA1362 family protein [Paucisalibacillus sp. EB02]
MRKKSILKYIIIGIVVLAAFGLIMELFTNATGFLTNILVAAVFALLIFGFFYYFLLGGRNLSSDAKKYKQAVRQSNSKYTQSRSTPTVKNKYQVDPIKKRLKKRPNHLRVIDGNKSKRKKRASN